MTSKWNIEKVRSLIADKVEESLSLEYKSSAALERTDKVKKEITKDVSAFANSCGGVIVYGMEEGHRPEDKHLPNRISPISRKEFSKEWLESIISNIRPKIEGLAIHPIPIEDSNDEVLYVVEVPQSDTAHQAIDFRYYKRWNFESVPMQDFEVRDTMNRSRHPKLEVLAFFVCETLYSPIPKPSKNSKSVLILKIVANNIGSKYAKYVSCFVDLPTSFARLCNLETIESLEIAGVKYTRYVYENIFRDKIKDGIAPQFGPSRHVPILPGLNRELIQIQVRDLGDGNVTFIRSPKLKLHWRIHADEALPISGEITFDQIRLIDQRKVKEDGDIWDRLT